MKRVNRFAFLISAAVLLLLASRTPVGANGCSGSSGLDCHNCTSQAICHSAACSWHASYGCYGTTSGPPSQAVCRSYDNDSAPCAAAGCHTWPNGTCQLAAPPYLGPANLTYEPNWNPVIITIGQSYNSGVPLHSGGAVSSYSVSPALPPGLSLNSASGAISGTPSAAKAVSNYSVTASGPAGSTSMAVNIWVVLPSPPLVHYKYNPVIYYKGYAIAPNSPNFMGRGDAASSWSVSPALPAGLHFDNGISGVITGTPTAAQAAANYTVTGSNAGGATTQVVTISVILNRDIHDAGGPTRTPVKVDKSQNSH